MRNVIYHISRRLRREKVKTIFLFLTTYVMCIAFVMLYHYLINNEKRIDNLYNTMRIEANIVKKNNHEATDKPNYISEKLVHEMKEKNFAEIFYLEAQGCNAHMFLEDEIIYSAEKQEYSFLTLNSPVDLYATNNLDIIMNRFKMFQEISIDYGQKWSETLFYEQWISEDAVINDVVINGKGGKYVNASIPILISKKSADSKGLNSGDCIYIFYENTLLVKCEIAGMYEGLMTDNEFFFPTEVYQKINEIIHKETFYCRCDFLINGKMNKNIDNVCERIRNLVTNDNSSLADLSVVFLDTELNEVIRPLEKRTQLLNNFYPIVVCSFLSIWLVVALLTILKKDDECKIMRILGVSKRKIIFIFLGEFFIINLSGGILGVISCAAISNVFVIPSFLFVVSGMLVSLAGASLGLRILLSKKII